MIRMMRIMFDEYTPPKMDITVFDCCDIITTSEEDKSVSSKTDNGSVTTNEPDQGEWILDG